MSHATVSHATMTISTVDVFIEQMKFISKHNLWDEVQAYLKENRKTDMFVDYDVLYLFREMVTANDRFDRNEFAIKTLLRHDDPFKRYLEKSS